MACNVPAEDSHGGSVGRTRRPIGHESDAFAAPTKGWPVVLDFSTCMIPEGKMRLALFQHKPVPEDCIQDAEGNPTTDPALFYSPTRTRSSAQSSHLARRRFGYKGYGLAMMAEIMGGILSGEDATVDHNRSNGVSLVVINPDIFAESNCSGTWSIASASIRCRRGRPRDSGGGCARHLGLPHAREAAGRGHPDRRERVEADCRGRGNGRNASVRAIDSGVFQP